MQKYCIIKKQLLNRIIKPILECKNITIKIMIVFICRVLDPESELFQKAIK